MSSLDVTKPNNLIRMSVAQSGCYSLWALPGSVGQLLRMIMTALRIAVEDVTYQIPLSCPVLVVIASLSISSLLLSLVVQ